MSPQHALAVMETSSIPPLWAGARPVGRGKGLSPSALHLLDHEWILRPPQYMMDVNELHRVQGRPQGGCAGAQEAVWAPSLEVLQPGWIQP